MCPKNIITMSCDGQHSPTRVKFRFRQGSHYLPILYTALASKRLLLAPLPRLSLRRYITHRYKFISHSSGSNAVQTLSREEKKKNAEKSRDKENVKSPCVASNASFLRWPICKIRSNSEHCSTKHCISAFSPNIKFFVSTPLCGVQKSSTDKRPPNRHTPIGNIPATIFLLINKPEEACRCVSHRNSASQTPSSHCLTYSAN